MNADHHGETDERLAALAAGGDRGAFDAMVTRHRQAVYRLCWSATGNADDADDAAQETFVRVYRSLPSYDPARPFGPWIRKIAWNCGLSVRRDRCSGVPKVAEGDAPEAVDPAPGPEEAAAGNEERQRMAGAMAGLPPELRMVMVLRAVEGLSYDEIALAAGIPAGTVMSRLSRARKRLLAALGAKADGQGRPSAGAGRDASGSIAPADGQGRPSAGAGRDASGSKAPAGGGS